MLKKRIIPVELFDSGRLYKSRCFRDNRDVGDPIKSSKVYSDQDADELIFLNICRDRRNIDLIEPVVVELATNCFVPLSVGGGINTVDDATRLFMSGADKVIINSLSFREKTSVEKIANRHGSQAVVICIDAKKHSSGDGYALFSDCGRKFEEDDLTDHIASVIDAGAGEIMIQSITRDGMMQGYDLNLIEQVVSLSTVPVIVAGGAGDFMDLKDAFDYGADAVACGSLFNFGDNNPLRAKSFLKNYEIPLKKI